MAGRKPAKKPAPIKKPPKKYTPPAVAPAPIARVQANWQCMHGCGSGFGNMNLLRSHESNCSSNPANG